MKLSPKRRKSLKNIRKSSLKNKSFKQMTGGDGSDGFKIPTEPTKDFDDYREKCNLLIAIIKKIEEKEI